MLEFLLVFAVLAAAVWIVSGPLRSERSGQAGATAGEDALDRAALEAAKEAKYREIREAELDFRTGKLAEDDYRELDGVLRAEAIEILQRIDDARPGPAGDGR